MANRKKTKRYPCKIKRSNARQRPSPRSCNLGDVFLSDCFVLKTRPRNQDNDQTVIARPRFKFQDQERKDFSLRLGILESILDLVIKMQPIGSWHLAHILQHYQVRPKMNDINSTVLNDRRRHQFNPLL